MDVLEGRNALAKVLDREAERAKENLTDALAKAKRRIAEAEEQIRSGNGVSTSVSGEGMILGHEGTRIDVFAGEWMAAERRRATMLATYDEVYGTAVEV